MIKFVDFMVHCSYIGCTWENSRVMTSVVLWKFWGTVFDERKRYCFEQYIFVSLCSNRFEIISLLLVGIRICFWNILLTKGRKTSDKFEKNPMKNLRPKMEILSLKILSALVYHWSSLSDGFWFCLLGEFIPIIILSFTDQCNCQKMFVS